LKKTKLFLLLENDFRSLLFKYLNDILRM